MIYPLFERLVQNQWVNAGFLRDFGWGSPSDFLAPDTLRLLASACPGAGVAALADLRTLSQSRPIPAWNTTICRPTTAMGSTCRRTIPRQWMAVLPIQYAWLLQWANGDFDADWPAGGLTFPATVEDLPLAEQPEALDRAALDECLGGPFHPGCEMTWPMRQTLLYEAPFRLRRRRDPEPDWGPEMTSEIALAEDGPLAASGPGGLSRWMAVPWQTDTSSCLSRYKHDVDGYLPTFWPARVPNDVLDLESYQAVMDDHDQSGKAAAGIPEPGELAARSAWISASPAASASMRSSGNGQPRAW